MDKLILSIILIFSFYLSIGQSSDSTKWKIISPLTINPSVAYVYQETNNLELTVGPIGWRKGMDEYFILRTGVDIFKHNVWYLTPVVTIAYSKGIIPWKYEGGIGFTSSCTYWRKNILSDIDTRITPEIGIFISYFHLTYGYNIPVGAKESPIFGRHRIALRIGV